MFHPTSLEIAKLLTQSSLIVRYLEENEEMYRPVELLIDVFTGLQNHFVNVFWNYWRKGRLTLCCRSVFFVTLVPKLEGGLRKPPSIFGTGRTFFMQFSLNGRSSILIGFRWCTVDDCMRTGNQDGGRTPEAGMNKLRSQLLYVVETEISKPNRHFCGRRTQRDSWSYSAMSAWSVYQRWPPLTGSICEIMQYLSFQTSLRRNSKGCSHILVSSNTAGLV